MSKRVIFVDDQVNLTQGIKRTIRKLKRDWDCKYVSSAREALVEVESWKPDVIVTDMKMPVMNGLELCMEMKVRYPSVYRIVLTGQTDIGTYIEGMKYVHRFLTKPCPVEEIIKNVEELTSLEEILQDPK